MNSHNLLPTNCINTAKASTGLGMAQLANMISSPKKIILKSVRVMKVFCGTQSNSPEELAR